jgi:hypothetical protein
VTNAGQILALEVSAGAGGFLVVLLLGLAAVGLFVMMSRSLVRLRGNVAHGRFGGHAARREKPSGGSGSDIPSQGTARD